MFPIPSLTQHVIVFYVVGSKNHQVLLEMDDAVQIILLTPSVCRYGHSGPEWLSVGTQTIAVKLGLECRSS